MKARVVLLLIAVTACSSSTAVQPQPSPTGDIGEPTSVALSSPASQCHIRGQLPDPICTPGAIDPRVTQDNIGQTICVTGYTRTVRPPVSYTAPLKIKQIAEYGYADTYPAHYEEDHLIPLELGGAPSDPRNLWPEPGSSPNPKDRTENRLHALVCAGTLSLAAAQHSIANDWTLA